MRILMLTQSYPPVIGGIEGHVQNLSRELAARGHQVSVATLWQTGFEEFELDGEVRVHRLHGTVQRAARRVYSNPRRWYVPPCPDPELTAGLRRVVREEQPDIVHAHNWMVHSYLPLKRWAGVPLVLTLHDYSFRCAKWILMYEDRPCSGPSLAKCWRCSVANYGLLKGAPTLLSNWAMARPERRRVDLFVPVSRAVAVGNDLAGQGLPYEVIPNFLPDPGAPAASEDVAALVAQLPAEPYLLFVGAFGRHKGFGVLLKAYAALQERLGEAATPPLVLIGYETGEFPLEHTPIPPKVTVFKHWPHPAVMAAWERCLLGVVPSVWPDPCPTVAMEAMSAGRAVAASAIGGLPDLVDDGETGLLLPPDDAGALADGLARLLADDAWRAALGAAGRAKYDQFRAATVVPRIEQAYRRLLSGPA